MTIDLVRVKTGVNAYTPSNTGKAIHTAYCFYSLYRLWESAISHLLALHRLRHGTSPLNYLKIQFTGLNPEVAVHSAGEAAYFEVTDPERNSGEPRERLIYVMKDQSSTPCLCQKTKKPFCKNFTLSKRLDPIEYAYQASAALWAFKNIPPAFRTTLMKIGGLLGCLTPILKFHFDPNQLEQFENDPWLRCTAFRSQKPISATRLGPLGALRVGLNNRLVARIKQHPQIFLVGLVQALAATVITLECATGCITQSDLIKQSTLKVSLFWTAAHATFFTAT
jgi:hypothetical protein